MKRMSDDMIRSINAAVFFAADRHYDAPAMKPWQYVRMEYERVGMAQPRYVPDFASVGDAQIWMCLDGGYNARLREAV